MVLYGAMPGSHGDALLAVGLPNFELSYPDVDQLAFRHHWLTLLEHHKLGFHSGRLDQPPDLPGSIQYGRFAVVPGSGCGRSGFHHVNPTEGSPGRAGRLRIPHDSGATPKQGSGGGCREKDCSKLARLGHRRATPPARAGGDRQIDFGEVTSTCSQLNFTIR